MSQSIEKIQQANSVQRQKARMMQKILWHIRWILLIVFIIFNAIGLMTAISVHYFLAVNGIGLCLYLLLGQLEGYFDCKSNCHI